MSNPKVTLKWIELRESVIVFREGIKSLKEVFFMKAV